MYSADGGVDIEQAARDGALVSRSCAATSPPSARASAALAAAMPPAEARAFRPVAEKLAALLFEKELLLAEINPLFCTPDGAVAADAKIVVDTNALERQGELRESRRPPAADLSRHLAQGA